jgi:hypothetical protein
MDLNQKQLELQANSLKKIQENLPTALSKFFIDDKYKSDIKARL